MSDEISLRKSSGRAIIPVLLVAAFVVILNETTMNVALTAIMADMHVTERTAQVRCLTSARNASVAFDLRAEVREKMLAFMRDECPEALPRDRMDFDRERRRPAPRPTGYEE